MKKSTTTRVDAHSNLAQQDVALSTTTDSSEVSAFNIYPIIPFEEFTDTQMVLNNFKVRINRVIWREAVVATKMINSLAYCSREDFLKKFKNEVDIMSQLDNPNIVKFHGVYLNDLIFYIVMEYMPSGSLDQVLQNQTIVLDWKRRRQIAIDIAKGLSYLHEKNILHRDLKSLNILLDEALVAKLCDFGLAIKESDLQTNDNNKSMARVGTLMWMAPEYLKDGVASKKSDMYSFGVTLWELVSRRRPFSDFKFSEDSATRWKEIGAKVLRHERDAIPTDTPGAVARTITFCWKKTPERRPDAATVVQCLSSATIN
jgi:serine/threonine protein kinase